VLNLDTPLKLQERTVLGKKLGEVRGQGMVPAVIHNHGQPSIHVMAPELELEKVYQAAGKHHPLNLVIGDQKFLVLIKDAPFHPVKRRLQHVVFQAIRRDEKVEAEVPIHLEGEIPAEKAGLQVLHHLDHVEVEALPSNLPDSLVADMSVLAEIGDRITVGDLKVPEGVTVLTEPEQSIAAVVEPKEQVVEPEPSEEAEAAEGGDDEEGGAEASESGGATAAEQQTEQ
jgi:large subunit ribosomal protein L25